MTLKGVGFPADHFSWDNQQLALDEERKCQNLEDSASERKRGDKEKTKEMRAKK